MPNVQRDESNLRLNLTVNKNGGVTGLTATVRLRDKDVADSYLDFADGVWKTSGWTTQAATMTDLNGATTPVPGGYEQIASIANLPPTSTNLIAEYSFSGAESGVASEEFTVVGPALEVKQSWVFQQEPLAVNARGSIWLERDGQPVVLPGTARLALTARDRSGGTVFWSASAIVPNAGGDFTHNRMQAVTTDIPAAFALLGVVAGELLVFEATLTLTGVDNGTQIGYTSIAIQDQDPAT